MQHVRLGELQGPSKMRVSRLLPSRKAKDALCGLVVFWRYQCTRVSEERCTHIDFKTAHSDPAYTFVKSSRIDIDKPPQKPARRLENYKRCRIQVLKNQKKDLR